MRSGRRKVIDWDTESNRGIMTHGVFVSQLSSIKLSTGMNRERAVLVCSTSHEQFYSAESRVILLRRTSNSRATAARQTRDLEKSQSIERRVPSNFNPRNDESRTIRVLSNGDTGVPSEEPRAIPLRGATNSRAIAVRRTRSRKRNIPAG